MKIQDVQSAKEALSKIGVKIYDLSLPILHKIIKKDGLSDFKIKCRWNFDDSKQVLKEVKSGKAFFSVWDAGSHVGYYNEKQFLKYALSKLSSGLGGANKFFKNHSHRQNRRRSKQDIHHNDGENLPSKNVLLTGEDVWNHD